MTYDTLLAEAINTLPDFRKEYEKAMADKLIDDETGMHIVFGYVFVPVLIDLIKGKKVDTTPWFEFIEAMSLCDDGSVVEVCDFTVLEALCDEFSHEELYPLLGVSTKDAYILIRRYIGE